METSIVYEDDNLIVADKVAGLVVHPGARPQRLSKFSLAMTGVAGTHEKTLVDWFIGKFPEGKNFQWPDPERAGIVHRLDKDTSGLIILAKNPEALAKLQELFLEHKIKKTYLALVFGKLEKPAGEITGFIGRDPNARRQQISQTTSFDFQPGKHRQSKTFYKVVKYYRYKNYDLTLVEATLDTGRMHQIRVHFKSIGHPLIGDPIYNIKHSRIVSKSLNLHRQFLHAHKLSFINPFEKRLVEVTSPLPKDLENIILELR